MSHDMKKTLVAGLLGVSLVFLSSTVQAGGYGHGGHNHNNGDDLLIAAGIIGGAFILGSMLTRPRYYEPQAYYKPAPVYYQPAWAYVPTCYQDNVWRRLPDGRIQTGTRTRCY